jgi:hypothetical protein
MATVKKVLKILTYLQVIAALAAIGLAIYLLVSVYLLAEAVAIILLCLGIALLVFSLFGVIGLQRKSKFCLCLYQVSHLFIKKLIVFLFCKNTVLNN